MGSFWKGFRSALAVALAACFALCFVSCADEKADVDPNGLSYTVEEMFSTREGMKIYGKLYAPKESDGKMPAVILSHSANMTADSMNAYAAGFAAIFFSSVLSMIGLLPKRRRFRPRP